ncbi:MAG: hypothetical protein FJ316_05620 [SAR202 cluster bacterium]|nr:hypothetical protein [SAR202 cluster bacterium]
MTSSKLLSGTFQFSQWEEAQEYYLENGLTDGLPIVPPSEERVRAMLQYAGLAPNAVIGTETIRQKRFTAEKAAIAAVMAGCKPEYFPVVLAAVAAACERPFNLHASSTSTNGVTVLALVSGPYAAQIGMNCGVSLMGAGNRANATIGRAINLFKAGFYGSIPRDMDNSTLGHPGKFTFCFAEDLEHAPWPSLAQSKGFGPQDSTVTIYAANAPLQVSIYTGKAPEDFLTAVSHAMLGLGHSLSEVLVVVGGELMGYLTEARWSRQQVQDFLYQKTRRPLREWVEWHRVDHPQPGDNPDRLLGCVAEPGRITVAPGGGMAGAFVSIIPSWGGSRSITRQIQTSHTARR